MDIVVISPVDFICIIVGIVNMREVLLGTYGIDYLSSVWKARLPDLEESSKQLLSKT
jgi:hypothetical protein